MRYIISIFLLCNCLAAQGQQSIPQIPNIPAFLPMAHSIPEQDASPIDGEWMINTLSKRIRIQGGRAYALEPWLHMFVLQVKPMMVVISDIVTTDGQTYQGKDLPLIGTWNAVLDQSGTLNVTVQSMLGPIRYGLMPVDIDDRDAFEQAKSGEGYSSDDEYPEYDDDEDYDDDDDYEDEDSDDDYGEWG